MALSWSTVDEITHLLFDTDSQHDIAFWLYATASYCVARMGVELLLPGKVKGYTNQQYVVTLVHQVLVLPTCAFGWAMGWLDDAKVLIYLLTGAYLASDSIVNYSPVSGCVAGVEGPPTFSWGVHAHHLFTIALCALGTTLPPWLEDEGAICILVGEAGSLWITVTLLWPTALNFRLRLLSFVLSRVTGVAIALWIVVRLESAATQLVLLAMMAGLVHDNLRTSRAMIKHARDAAHGKAQAGTWPL